MYLDHAATTPVRPEALSAMIDHLSGTFGNPSSHHTVGEAAAHALEDARRRVAAVVGMRPSDVIFTSGGTEANNLAVKGLVLGAAARRPRPLRLVTTPIEHESILATGDYLERVHAAAVTRVPVSRTGLVGPESLAAALGPENGDGVPATLVSMGYANNEVGTVQDVAAIAAICREAGVPLHLDAVQAAGWLPLTGTGADALSIAGHKIGAPPGIGVLAVRARLPLEPVLHGGGQERDRRSGTENVAGAVAFAVALELAEKERVSAAERLRAQRDDLIRAVLSRVPHAALTGDPVHRLPGTASFVFPGVSGEAVLLELERRGIVSSSGSACAAGSDEPSHVLVAMGIDPEVARTAVRFTFGHRARLDVPALADAIDASVARVRSGA